VRSEESKRQDADICVCMSSDLYCCYRGEDQILIRLRRSVREAVAVGADYAEGAEGEELKLFACWEVA